MGFVREDFRDFERMTVRRIRANAKVMGGIGKNHCGLYHRFELVRPRVRPDGGRSIFESSLRNQ
jgi:hypothetical protein